MAYLQNIERFTNDGNIGGLLQLRLIRKDDVDFIPEPADGVIFGDIVPKAGRAFVSWNVTFESAGSESQNRISREGASKENSIRFLIPKDRASMKSQLDAAVDDEFIVIVIDGNGTAKVFGSLDMPMRFAYDHSSGEAISNRNSYTCRFYFENGPDNSFHYNGSLSAPPAGSPPAIVRYNGVVIASLAPGETLNITSDFGFTDFYISS